MPTPLVILSFKPPFSAADFSDFAQSHADANAEVVLDVRESSGPQAGIEWLLPTAVFLFIGKSYFDGMLKELGKEHYHLLKAKTRALYARLIGPNTPAVTVVGTVGKLASDRKYSLLFSLLAEADDGLRFKLLIQESATEAEYSATVEAFVDFLDAFHRGTLAAEVITELKQVRIVGKTVLLAYSKEHGRLVAIDPLARLR
ncbi:hypothetical protein ACWA7J_06350 [Leptothrix sp. BB-4]